MGTNAELDELIMALEAQLEDLKAQLPAHSITAAMLIALEDLASALEEARRRRDRGGEGESAA